MYLREMNPLHDVDAHAAQLAAFAHCFGLPCDDLLPLYPVTLRAAIRFGYADLSKGGWWKCGSEGYGWLDEMSFDDAICTGCADLLPVGRYATSLEFIRAEKAVAELRVR